MDSKGMPTLSGDSVPTETPGPGAFELDDEDYVVLERPKSALTNNSRAPSSSSAMEVTSTLIAPVSGVSETASVNVVRPAAEDLLPLPGPAPLLDDDEDDFYVKRHGQKAYNKKAGVSDLMNSSDGDDSSSGSDSDVGKGFAKKRSRMNQPGVAAAVGGPSNSGARAFGLLPTLWGMEVGSQQYQPQDSAQDLSSFNAAAARYSQQHQQRIRPNNVWANVVQDEQISDMFGVQATVQEPTARDIEVTRGPETYSYQKSKREPRKRRESESSDVSSGGLSDDTKNYLRGVDDQKAKDEAGTGSGEVSGSLPPSKAKSARKVTKAMQKKQKMKLKIFERLRTFETRKLAEFFAYKLKEKRVDLIVRAIEVIGKDNTIHLFLKTCKIEERGGILVKSQSRRRTPGGVFFYLIRGDRRFAKSQIDLIFTDYQDFQEKLKRKLQVARRSHGTQGSDAAAGLNRGSELGWEMKVD